MESVVSEILNVIAIPSATTATELGVDQEGLKLGLGSEKVLTFQTFYTVIK